MIGVTRMVGMTCTTRINRMTSITGITRITGMTMLTRVTSVLLIRRYVDRGEWDECDEEDEYKNWGEMTMVMR